MKQVLYDPGVGELANGVYFRGWTTDKNYTTNTQANSIEEVRTEVAGMLPPDSDGTEVTYYAMLFKDYRITYLDENDISLGQEEVAFRADATSAAQSYKVNMAYMVQDDTHHFEGWKVREGGSNIEGYTSGKIYENNDVISITGDITFGVNAPEGHWFVFDENGKGATYNAPQFIQSGDHPTRPNDANMIRNGYTFGGWYEDKAVADQTSGGTQYNFNQELTDKVTVYARWIPKATAGYTIIVWKQNIAGDGYDFVESITGTGNVGSVINAVSSQGNGTNRYARINGENYQYTGFHLKEFDQNVTIKTEGSSVLNVYYDRNEYTLTFQDHSYTATTGDNGTQYGLVEGQYVQLTRHNSGSYWNPNYYWTYGNNIRYNGTRYTRGNGWITIKEIKALYGQNIFANFPIVGTNGATYNHGERWDPQSTAGSNDVIVFLEIMPAKNETYRLDTAQRTTRTMNYYVEALPGQTADVTYNGKSFILYNTIYANLGYIDRELDWVDLNGYQKFGSNPSNWDNNGRLDVEEINFFYTRDIFSINFMDGKYVNGDNNPMDETSQGQIHTQGDIAYGADVSSYNDYEPDAAHTPAGYVFEGWYLDDACTQPYTFNKMPEGGVTVYAKWRQKQYRVFLHVNYPEGATGNINWGTPNQQMNFRISEGGHVSEPTGRDLAGYDFVGWYLDEECTQVFNGEAYTINESNVTTPYDKTVDMTDTYDNNGNLIDPKRNSDATGYNGGDRFWITKKLDIYAKWRSTLEGASGIVVEYNAGDGTGAPTDTHTYVDGAKAPAGAASKPPAGSHQVFGYWEVQKWENGEWKGTGTKVYPGKTFTVQASNAKVEDITPAAGSTDTKKYTVQLKAVYIDTEQPTPTHIYWYKNDGSDAYIKDESLEINKGVTIPNGENGRAVPTREGYNFVGWSRVNISTSNDPAAAAEEAAAWEAESDNWTQPNATPYVTYADGTYKLGDKTVTQVAADEDRPYQAMFAVWEPINYKVRFNKNADDATGEMADQNFEYNEEKALTSNAFTRPHYTFAGWNTVADGSGTSYTNEQVVKNLTTVDDEVIDLYAQWTNNKYPYTIHHYLKGTTTKVAEDVTGEEEFGKTVTATPVTTYQEKDLTVDSYNPSQSITISEEGNVITIYYTLPLTITAKTDSKKYDGTPLNGEYTITGNLESDKATIEEALGAAPSITNYTESPKNYLTETEQAAITGIPGYYTVEYTPGTLTIDQRTVTLTSAGDTKVYDGTAQKLI